MGYEQDVEKLQTFCTTLEGTNHLLESAATDLGAVGKALVEAEPDLREALAGLESDTQALEHELETSAKQAKDDAAELGHAGQQAVETRLPALDGHVGDAKSHLHQAVPELGTGLESELNELLTHGFEPFDSTLTGEQSEFERWTHEADAALATLVEALESASNETVHDIQQAGADLQAVLDAVQHEHTEWQRTLDDDNEHVGTELPGQVDHTFSGLDASIPHWVHELGESVQAALTADREMVLGYGKEGGVALGEESSHATDDVHKAQGSLEEAGIEFEQTAADADSAEATAGEVADLRPMVETADAHVVQIRNVTDAMSHS